MRTAATAATDKAGMRLTIAAVNASKYSAKTGGNKSTRFEIFSLIGILAGMGDTLYQLDHGRIRGQVPARYPVVQHVVLCIE
jgi:hypothetical protein